MRWARRIEREHPDKAAARQAISPASIGAARAQRACAEPGEGREEGDLSEQGLGVGCRDLDSPTLTCAATLLLN